MPRSRRNSLTCHINGNGAEARLRLAEYDLETKIDLGDATTELSVEQARSERDAAAAEVAELTKRQPTLAAQRVALSRLVKAAGTRLELKTDEQQALDAAQARLLAAQSRLEQARVAVDEAHLRLSRMTINAPVDGRILDLTTQPGSFVTGSTGAMQGEDRSTVVKMYRPDALQVRVDVRFEDLPQTGRGQPVAIRSPAVAEPLIGEVLFLTGFANIQKNTLEVKVSVDAPTPPFSNRRCWSTSRSWLRSPKCPMSLRPRSCGCLSRSHSFSARVRTRLSGLPTSRSRLRAVSAWRSVPLRRRDSLR